MALAQKYCNFILPQYIGTFSYIYLPKNAKQRAKVHLNSTNTTSKLGISIKCSTSFNTPNPSNPIEKRRSSATYKPSIWSYDFVQSLKEDSIPSTTKEKAKKLIEEVRKMISNKFEEGELLSTLELIDDVQRLGLGYHFEENITLVLQRFNSLLINDNNIVKSLHASALSFRLLRQHGFEISQDIFNSFKDDEGNFKACLSKDVEGMLSLYEASYLAFEGESLLDKAKTFTTTHLKNFSLENTAADKQLILMVEEVNQALELPLHQQMLRLQARCYIEAYSKRPNANQALLEAARLDFNMVQSTLQRDLKEMSSWWNGLELASNLSFSRDRLMECFFWAMGMVFEPQFSYVRKGLTKVAVLITVIDDVYDVHGTLDELELFTYAVERWDVNAVKVLPDYMKICFLALYNTVNEMAYDVLKNQGENILPYVTKAWADALKGYLQEAKWSKSKCTPTFKEYLENGWVSVSGVVLLVHAYCLMTQNITKQGLECLQSHHTLLRCPSTIFRLCNDLATSTAEIERGETASSIFCIMQHETTSNSEELARAYLRNLIQDTWKKMNKELQLNNNNNNTSSLAKPFLQTSINLARIAQCTYQHGDGHGAPDAKSTMRVLSLIIDPIF